MSLSFPLLTSPSNSLPHNTYTHHLTTHTHTHTRTHTHTHTHTHRSLDTQLIEERGATNALAAALACISGAREISTRSLLSAQQVSITFPLVPPSSLPPSTLFHPIFLLPHITLSFLPAPLPLCPSPSLPIPLFAYPPLCLSPSCLSPSLPLPLFTSPPLCLSPSLAPLLRHSPVLSSTFLHPTYLPYTHSFPPPSHPLSCPSCPLYQ